MRAINVAVQIKVDATLRTVTYASPDVVHPFEGIHQIVLEKY